MLWHIRSVSQLDCAFVSSPFLAHNHTTLNYIWRSSTYIAAKNLRLSEPFAFGPPQGLTPCRHDRFVLPLTVPCEATACRLAAVGNVKGEGVAPEVSLWVGIFVSETRPPGFISSTSGFSRWPGQEQEAPSSVIFSEKATQTSGIRFEVKFGFGLCISKL